MKLLMGALLLSDLPSRRIILQTAVQVSAFTRFRTLFAAIDSTKQSATSTTPTPSYPDGRPTATLRLDAVDPGPIIRHGSGPARCDYLGAREAICFRSGETYYLHYDGAGPTGWRACLAASHDLRHWDLKGPVLDLGDPGAMMLEQRVRPGRCSMASGGICFTLVVEPQLPLPIAFPPFLISRWRQRVFILKVPGRSRRIWCRSEQSRAPTTLIPPVQARSSNKAMST